MPCDYYLRIAYVTTQGFQLFSLRRGICVLDMLLVSVTTQGFQLFSLRRGMCVLDMLLVSVTTQGYELFSLRRGRRMPGVTGMAGTGCQV